MVQPSVVLVTSCIPFWCCISNSSFSKGGVSLVLDLVSQVLHPQPGFLMLSCPSFHQPAPSFASSSLHTVGRAKTVPKNPVVAAWFQLATSCRTCCQGTLQGLHSLKKSWNFRWSRWKVLKCLCKASNSFWFYFNFECSGQQSSEKLRVKGDLHRAFFVLCKN